MDTTSYEEPRAMPTRMVRTEPRFCAGTRSATAAITTAGLNDRASRAPSQQSLTSRTAPTHDQSFPVSPVVVAQLLTFRDGPSGADPNDAVLDLDVAVRTARVVDEPRVVAADAGIDHRPVRQLEAPDVSAPDVAPLTLQALLVRNSFTCVVDDAGVLRDAASRVYAPTV